MFKDKQTTLIISFAVDKSCLVMEPATAVQDESYWPPAVTVLSDKGSLQVSPSLRWCEYICLTLRKTHCRTSLRHCA